MDNVLLVAVGGIGFRHFQALLNCRSEFNLYVVDINPVVVQRAKDYASSQRKKKDILYFSSISEIDRLVSFRLAIIATSSLPRRAVFEGIVAQHAVETVIFEKILFPKLRDYAEVGAILEQKNIRAYVNCARRLSPGYQALREELRNAGNIYFRASGSNWGLACNAIHMIDLADFLTSNHGKTVLCNGALLEDQLFESKRNGYTEFYGSLLGRLGNQTDFHIECVHGQSPFVIELHTTTAYYRIEEGADCITKIGLDSGSAIRTPLSISFISQTTTEVVDQIFAGQPAGLIDYSESARLHVPILREFIKKRNFILGREEEICPIT